MTKIYDYNSLTNSYRSFVKELEDTLIGSKYRTLDIQSSRFFLKEPQNIEYSKRYLADNSIETNESLNSYLSKLRDSLIKDLKKRTGIKKQSDIYLYIQEIQAEKVKKQFQELLDKSKKKYNQS